MSVTRDPYGTLPDGRAIEQFTLSHAGLTCRVITLGGILTELHVPDRDGVTADIVLGLPTLEAYAQGHPYFGTITGRVAGRINGGSFELDGTRYQLELNQPPNHLHGGSDGLAFQVWEPETGTTPEGEPFVSLHHLSPDGKEGYPGNLDLIVRYTLTDDAALRIDYTATTDAATPVSLTNHAYFNLAGEGHPTIAGHVLRILSDRIVKKDAAGTLDPVPTPVDGTVHDFRAPRALADFIAPPDGQHGENYLLREGNADTPELAAVVTEPGSGRKMEVLTTATGVQLYTSQTLHNPAEGAVYTGKSGRVYPCYSALCLECQGMPNGVNTPEIDDIILRPGDTYRQTTLYRFSVE